MRVTNVFLLEQHLMPDNSHPAYPLPCKHTLLLLLLLLLLLSSLMLFWSFHVGTEGAKGFVPTKPEKGRKESFFQNVFNRALASNQSLDHILWGSNSCHLFQAIPLLPLKFISLE